VADTVFAGRIDTGHQEVNAELIFREFSAHVRGRNASSSIATV